MRKVCRPVSRSHKLAATALAAILVTAALAARFWPSRAPNAPGADLVQQRRFAVTSSLWRNDGKYARYALVLGHSLVQSNGPFMEAEGVDMLMLTYPDSAFPPATLDSLQAVGWKMRNVSRVAALPGVNMNMENFGRLHLWEWTEYSRVVYIDADCMVMRDISGLFHLPAGITAAVGDAWPKALDHEHFNAGVLSLEPSMIDFENLMSGYQNHTMYKNQGAAEQGLLNHYFKHNITNLPRIYNFNLVMSSRHKALWDVAKPDARIVHYTTYKPGNSREEDMLAVIDHPYAEIWGVNKDLQEPLGWWWDAYDAMSSAIKYTGLGQL